jgi:hypothetical protein
MRTKPTPAIGSIASFCCCAVLLAATVHLLHIHHPLPADRKHGKLELNVAGSPCLVSLRATVSSVHLPIRPAVRIVGRLHDEANNAHAVVLLTQPLGRAPPVAA